METEGWGGANRRAPNHERWGRGKARLDQAQVVQVEMQGIPESSSEDPADWDCGHEDVAVEGGGPDNKGDGESSGGCEDLRCPRALRRSAPGGSQGLQLGGQGHMERSRGA